jgi:hypothetical protein
MMLGGLFKLVGVAAVALILLIVGWFSGLVAFPWPFA